jgi:hypothetical protein
MMVAAKGALILRLEGSKLSGELLDRVDFLQATVD